MLGPARLRDAAASRHAPGRNEVSACSCAQQSVKGYVHGKRVEESLGLWSRWIEVSARRICVYTIAVWSLDVTTELRYNTASAVSVCNYQSYNKNIKLIHSNYGDIPRASLQTLQSISPPMPPNSFATRSAISHLPTARVLPPSVPSSTLIRFHTSCVVNKESGPIERGSHDDWVTCRPAMWR